jgi:predicted membrane protein (TIGR00267 family)
MFAKIKIYNEIIRFKEVMRRLFTINFFDGMLTQSGILLGFFIFLLNNNTTIYIDSIIIILPSVGTSLSMLLSGFSGSYLSEKTEQKIKKLALNKAMVVIEDKGKTKLKEKKIKTIHEKAESFANVIVSLTNGIAPFLGGLIPLIPFFFVLKAGILVFITSFIIIFVSIIILGIFLGIVSKESLIKSVIETMIGFIITFFVTFFVLIILF